MADFLTTLPVILVIMAAAAWRIRLFTSEERGLLWLSFFAHQVAAIAHILVMQYHYEGGDMLTYHRFGMVAADRLRSDFWSLAPGLLGLIFQRTDPIPIPIETFTGSTGSLQGYSAFAMFFFNDSLYATCAFIAGLAFFSKLALYSVAKAELPDVPQRALLWACMLVPSAIFWSCALLKEPIAMIGLLGITYAFQLFIVQRRRLAGVALTLLVAPLVLFTKGYLMPVLAVSGGVWYLLHALRARRGEMVIKLGHVIVAAASVIGVVLLTGALLPYYSVDALDDQLARLQVIGATLDAGSNYALGSGAGNAASQIALAPLALLTALFRPMLFEANSPLVLLSALEMTLFTVWAFMVPFRRGLLPALSEVLRHPFLAFCAVFVVVFGTCAGLGSTNLGTLSRYRMPLVPFFAIALATLLARSRAARASVGPQTPYVARLLLPRARTRRRELGTLMKAGPMKVALLVRSLNRGGAERQLVKLAKSLHSRGVEVVVITFYSGGAFEPELTEARIPVKSLNKASRWDIGSILVPLVQLLRRERPDVLYGFVVTPNLLASATKLLFPGLRVVWGIRCGRLDLSHYDWLTRAVYRLESALSSLPDLIIVNSLAGLEQLKERGIPERKLVQIPNGIDTAQYHPDPPGRARLRRSWGLDDSHTLVGMVTRADPVKGLDLFLDAASTLAASDPLLRFVCIGVSGDAAASLRARAERLGMGGQFTCEGPRDDLSATYSALDVHVLCSYSEGFPNVVAEAMACGTPCAVTSAGDAAEIVGELGAHTEPGDAAGLARAIRTVIVRLEREPAALRLAVRARIIEAYSLEKLATRTISALESLLPNSEQGHWRATP